MHDDADIQHGAHALGRAVESRIKQAAQAPAGPDDEEGACVHAGGDFLDEEFFFGLCGADEGREVDDGVGV